jgi:hypothetical protein
VSCINSRLPSTPEIVTRRFTHKCVSIEFPRIPSLPRRSVCLGTGWDVTALPIQIIREGLAFPAADRSLNQNNADDVNGHRFTQYLLLSFMQRSSLKYGTDGELETGWDLSALANGIEGPEVVFELTGYVLVTWKS